MAWKQPNRPNNEVSQAYNAGIVKIYSVEDIAQPGFMPVAGLTLKHALPYDERWLGITKFYSEKQNQAELERVIRVPMQPISTQDVAVTQDGRQYSINLVQTVKDVYPPSCDLTLGKIVQKYEVPT